MKNELTRIYEKRLAELIQEDFDNTKKRYNEIRRIKKLSKENIQLYSNLYYNSKVLKECEDEADYIATEIEFTKQRLSELYQA